MPRQRVTTRKRKRTKFSSTGKYWFDQKAASEAVEFIETFCSHVKGELAGQPLLLEQWEKFIIEELFGWKRKDNADPMLCTRQYRILWLEIPRKNGKSAISAAIALLLLFYDGEPGAEIYSAAGDREQASIVFDMAKQMREQSPTLASMSDVYGGQGGVKRSITFENSFYRVLSADAFTKHGLNAHGIVVDEVHVQKTRDLIDTLRTSVGSRRQPIEIYITTAGSDKNSICWEMHDYALKLIQGVISDDTFLPFIYAAGEKDDWTKPATWKKANPNLGVSVKVEYLEQECKRAINTPGYQNTFRRLHLNQWTEQDIRFLDMRHWGKCKGGFEVEKSDPCFGGLDLASTTDIAAFCLVFPPTATRAQWGVKSWFWVPEEGIHDRVKTDRAPYDVWWRDGFLFATDGNVIDYDYIRHEINQLGVEYNIKEIAADRWNATQIITQLEGDGFTMVPYGQGFASMSAPTKELAKLVKSNALRHGDHPVLNWMASNVTVKDDPAGNLKPDKSKSRQKIDGIVALIMGIGRAIVNKEKRSVYETRGVISVG